MSWFISHVYIAAWGLPNNSAHPAAYPKRSHESASHPLDTGDGEIAFLTCLAAVLTPGFDMQAHLFAGFIMTLILGYFLMGGLKTAQGI